MENENVAAQEENFEAEGMVEDSPEEQQDESLSLDDAMNDSQEQPKGDEQPQSAGGQKEPGWFRQRWEKEVG